MNERNFERRPSRGDAAREFDTQLRHSLTYDLIGSIDRFVSHPSTASRDARTTSNAVRLVEYTNGTDEQLRLRSKLLGRKLIVGAILSEDHDIKQVFRVPRSVRPIKHESSVRLSSHYSYGDRQLFSEVGALTGLLYRIENKRRALIGDIGMLITMREFTRPNERALDFTPGVEKAVVSLPEAFNPIEYYSEKLDSSFGDRFIRNTQAFKEAFEKV